MFQGANNFNQPINTWTGGDGKVRWETSNVTDMRYMFNGATNFNQELTGWNTSKVRFMQHMFNGATTFNRDIGMWDVKTAVYVNRTVTNDGLFGILQNANAFNQDLSRWCVSNYPVNYQSAYNLLTNVNPFASHTAYHPKWGSCPQPYDTFDTTWRIPSGNRTLTIPTFAGIAYDFTIDW